MIVAMTGAAKEQIFVTHISGDQQVPPAATNAQGQAVFKLNENGNELNFKLIAANIKNITAGYIQLGSTGINGPVVANLYTGPTIVGRSDGLIAEGNITASNLKGPLSGKNLSSLIGEMLSSNTYVNVLTTQNPAGEIRGQISNNGKLIEYVCVDKVANASPPPDIPGNKVKEVKQSLCEDGKVPESLIPMENKLKHMPEGGQLIPNAFCPKSGVCYEYAVSYQQIYNTGVSAYLSQHSPYVNPVDYHSVAEITVQNTNFGPSPGDAIEVGWIKNVNDVTRLFTFWWLNGNPQCYNGCGWIQWSATEYPGMAIATNFYPTIKDGYLIQNWQGNWWIWYNGQWIGYYPGSLWGNFVNGNLVQYFGEVSARSFPTNTQMGNGQYCRNEAIIDSQKYLNGAWINSNTIKFANYPYTETALSSNAMIYGGPVNPNIACLPNPVQ